MRSYEIMGSTAVAYDIFGAPHPPSGSQGARWQGTSNVGGTQLPLNGFAGKRESSVNHVSN